MTVAIATCDFLPELDPDDRALAEALEGLGFQVEPAIWTDRVRWNNHKYYLRDLERHGVRIVPTVWLDCGTDITLDAVLADTQWTEVVIEPALYLYAKPSAARALAEAIARRLSEGRLS